MRLNVLLLLVAVMGVVRARVIRVPGDSVDIQGGLNLARNGDTVLVAPGTYCENIVWPGLDGIRLLSEAGAETTIIDGRDSGRVITMNAISYSPATEVRGFTTTQGRVLSYPGNGAGVWCTGAPVFAANRIVNNLCFTMGYGGGVYAVGSPTFVRNLIAWDTIWSPGGGGWRYGAGICCLGAGVFYQNVFLENAAFDTFGGGFWYGGALYLAGSGIVFNNLFLRNQAGATTGGFAYGGALCIDSGSACVANNTFVANKCSTAVPYGGAIYIANTRTAVIKNNIIVQNVANGIAPFGGGIACRPDTLDTLVFGYNDVQGNLPADYFACRPGIGALALDPQFVAGGPGDYLLSQVAAGQPANSPCVDVGDTLLMNSPLNLDSLIRRRTTRTDSVPDADAIDIGYHYATEADVGVAQDLMPVNGNPAGLEVCPNPVRGPAQIAYVLARGGHVSVRLYDAAGREQASLFSGRQTRGRQRLALAPLLAPGVYFLWVSAADQDMRTRLTVVR
jgi:hypothetical protein